MCMRMCVSVCSKIDTTSHSGEKMVCRRVCALVLLFFMRTKCPKKDSNQMKIYFTMDSLTYIRNYFNYLLLGCMLTHYCEHTDLRRKQDRNVIVRPLELSKSLVNRCALDCDITQIFC